MAETFRRSKIEKFIKRLEAKLPALPKVKREVVKEIIAELEHEFDLKVTEGDGPSELADWFEKQTEEHLDKIWAIKEEQK